MPVLLLLFSHAHTHRAGRGLSGVLDAAEPREPAPVFSAGGVVFSLSGLFLVPGAAFRSWCDPSCTGAGERRVLREHYRELARQQREEWGQGGSAFLAWRDRHRELKAQKMRMLQQLEEHAAKSGPSADEVEAQLNHMQREEEDTFESDAEKWNQSGFPLFSLPVSFLLLSCKPSLSDVFFSTSFLSRLHSLRACAVPCP